MADKLTKYRSKRDASRTPEPVPKPPPEPQGGDAFVIQEHHARSLHWDLRLEHDGVLASWAIPKGLPDDSGTNRLAVHTEDHPLEYLTFHGEIPQGEYGGGNSLVDRPYTVRRAVLEALNLSTARWQTAPSWPGQAHPVRQAAKEQGLPGVIAKRLDSPYEPGESTVWLFIPS